MENGLVSDVKRVSDYKELENKILYDNHRDNSLKGILEESKLSNYFFSSRNKESINKHIRYYVNKGTGKVISKQSPEELYTIMRSIYLQEGGMRVSTDNDLAESINKLNKSVIDYSVSNISSQLKQYDTYLNDISKLPEPLEHPKYDRDNKTYDISNLL